MLPSQLPVGCNRLDFISRKSQEHRWEDNTEVAVIDRHSTLFVDKLEVVRSRPRANNLLQINSINKPYTIIKTGNA